MHTPREFSVASFAVVTGAAALLASLFLLIPAPPRKALAMGESLPASLPVSTDPRVINFQRAKQQLELDYKKARAIEDEECRKNCENPDAASITRAYVEAEERFGRDAESYFYRSFDGRDEARELFNNVQGGANMWAENWATSPTRGFHTVPPISLLDPAEFTKTESRPARWMSSPLASVELKNGVLIARGEESSQSPGSYPRAGVAFWGIRGDEIDTLNSGRDIVPATRSTMRNYSIRARFVVMKKGFILIARHTGGYQRHAYGFQTEEAEEWIRNANRKAAGRSHSSRNASRPSPPFPDDRSTNFNVQEGLSYQLREDVYGNKVNITIREIETGRKETVEDGVRARHGGIGIQLLPGAEVHFTDMELRVLLKSERCN